MALVLKDRVKETTTTTGTGTVTLAGAAAGFQSFVVIGDGNQTFYAIVDATSGAWEVGVGTYTASGTTLSRTTVVSSSNAGSLVNFGAGSKDVFVTYPSSRAVYLDAAGSAVSVLDIGTLGASTANITTANITAGTVSTTPTSANDLVNKTYVDTLAASGIHFHQPVRVEAPINLNATYNNGTAGVGATLTNAGTQAALVIDGVTVSVADRVLVYQQTTQTQNGIYVVTDVGSGSTNWILTRSSDADTYVINSAAGLSEGSTVFVQQGATGSGETYTCNTTGVITFGTTNITFAQISSAQIYSAGTGLTLSGTQFSITNTGTAGTYGSASSVPVITTNAQGQVTGVTPTAIAISGAAVSGNISGQAGSVANALTAGTFLTSGGTFDGSAARTFAVDATDANTASKVVARDASGNFSAGTITATLSGAATSATTATNLAGGAANRIAYQTSAGISNFIAAPTASNQVLNWNGSAFTWSAGTISGVALGSNLNTLTFGTFLTGTSYNGSGAVTIATNATNANTASTLVARDASGNFSAGTITAALSGNATTSSSTSGNAATATTLQTARTINGVSFNGSANITVTAAANGGNSATVGGFTPSASSGVGNRVVVADASGYIFNNYFNSTDNSQASGVSAVMVKAGDNYYRSGTAAAVATFISGQTMNIAGSATSLNSSNFISQTGSSGNFNTDFTNTPAGTFRYNGDSNAASNNPGGGWWLVQNMRHTNASNFWGTQVAWGWEDNANKLATRNVGAGSFGAWVYYLNSSNYTSYAPSLTGSGASGTWGINVTGSSTSCSGNAATATTATYLSGSGQINTIVGKNGTTADINAANDTGSFSIRGDASFPASVSFHRTGAYAINMGLSTGNNFVIGGWSASSNAFVMSGAGALTMLNNITAYSDERVKTNWRDLRPDFIERLAEVKHGIYDRTDQVSTQVGVSAQSLQKILEHAVMEGDDGHLSVAYGNAALVAAVKLAERVVALEARIAALEAKG
jgi:hypothetical protein